MDEKHKSLINQVKNNYGSVKDRKVVAGNTSYSVTEVLDKVRGLLHQQFQQPLEDDGTEKIFIPLASWMKEVILRNVDLDVKDIQVTSNTAPHGVTQLVRQFVHNYNKREKMGKFINKMADMLVSTGHVVIKKGEGLEIVDTNSVYFLGLDGIKTSGCIIAKELNYNILINKKKVWANFKEIEDQAKKLIEEGKEPIITVYEQWGNYIEGGKLKRGVIVTSDATTQGEPSTFHFSAVKKDYPFWECKQESLQGRANGRGTVEKVLGQSLQLNESANLKRKADRLTVNGLYLYQTNNPEMQPGTLDTISNGGVATIGTNESFTELNQRPKSTEFNQVEASTTEWARRITGGSEVSSGEQLPSSMPATSAALQQRSAATTFDLIRETMGLMLSEIYTEYIIPQISKEVKKGDLVQITPSKEDNMRTAEGIAHAEGVEVNEVYKKLQSKGKTMELKVMQDYFKDTKYIVDVYVTSEAIDKRALLAGMNDLILTYSQVAPGLINVEALITDTIDLLGLDGAKYVNTQPDVQPNPQQGAGQQAQPGQQGGTA